MKAARLRPARRTVALVLCLTAVTAPLSARAEPADEKAAAQVLFDDARGLVEKGDFASACPKFAESQRIDPGLGTMLWLADCYENSGQTASAWAAFKAAAGTAALRHDERERVARARAAHLEPNLTRLNIAVTGVEPEGLQVRRDGVLVGRAEWGRALPVDPGPHTVAAQALGFRPWSRSVCVSPNEASRVVTIPELEPDPPLGAGAPVAPLAHSVNERRAPSAAADGHGAAQRFAGISIASAGAAAILTGAFFSLRAKAIYDDSNDGTAPHCLADSECDAAGTKYRHDASSMATVATIAMSAGAAGVVGGAVLYFATPSALTRAVAFTSSPSGAAIHLRCRW